MIRQIVSRVPRVRRLAVALILAAAVGAGASRQAFGESVLDYAPHDAPVVIKVTNLQGTSNKIAALAQQFGVAMIRPELNDPLGALLAKGKITQGINKAGDMAIVMTTLPDAGEPTGLVLVPVSDYKAFLGNFADAKTDGAVTSFTDSEGKAMNAANWGSYAALSDKKEALAAKPDGLKLAGASAKELDTKDMVLFANMKVLGPKLKAKIEENRAKIIDAMEKGAAQGLANPGGPGGAGLAAGGQPVSPVMKAAVSQYLTAIEQMGADSEAATIGLSLNRDGIGTTALLQFAPASSLGQLAAGLKGSNATMLNGLPDAQYIAFGGLYVNGQAINTYIQDFAKPIVAAAGNGPEAKAVNDYLAAVKTALMATSQSTFGVLAPQGNLGETSLVQAITVTTGDAKGIMKSQQDAMAAEQGIMALMPNAQATQVKTTYTPAAKTMDGISFNEFNVSFNMNPKTPQEQQAASVLQFMYGPKGMTGLAGMVDDKHVLTLIGVPDATATAAITAAKGNADTLSKIAGVELVGKNLPQNRQMVMFFSLDTVVTTVAKYAGQMGFAVPLNLPPNLPPIGVALASDGPSVRIDSYTPSQLVSSMIAAGMQMMMQMNGAGKPGGPGGL